MSFLLLLTAVLFAAIAVFAQQVLDAMRSRYRLRPPHGGLLLVFRAWFAILALATVWLLFRQPRVGH